MVLDHLTVVSGLFIAPKSNFFCAWSGLWLCVGYLLLPDQDQASFCAWSGLWLCVSYLLLPDQDQASFCTWSGLWLCVGYYCLQIKVRLLLCLMAEHPFLLPAAGDGDV
jgi:hypothetical protein